MSQRARGTFDVELKTLPLAHENADPLLGRRSIDKCFHGDLDGRSRGEMLSAGTAVPGSAGYVAIERVEATLHGRTGTFVLHHKGTLTRSAQSLSVTVVPDSGTGELKGLSGSLAITIVDGKHHYDFEYTLDPG